MERKSSLSEKPRIQRPRRLTDWLNPAGEKKVHSLIDKIYKRKNLELAWRKYVGTVGQVVWMGKA
jgi:RNA-directed DNA polymerase